MNQPPPVPFLCEGRYELREDIGRGGMATVYRAYDHHLKVYRAIKVLHAKYSDHRTARQRFVAEAQTMARLTHPNVVRVYDMGVDAGWAYIVMELVEVGSVIDVLAAHGPLPACTAIDISLQVLSALQAAHRLGVVHRDIKPHNLLLSPQRGVLVTDFGIARVRGSGNEHYTRPGASMGTSGYMSPEQCAAPERTDLLTDIYAVGATLYALVVGENPRDLFASSISGCLEPLPVPVAKVIEKATRYKRSERYEDADAMMRALAAARERVPAMSGAQRASLVAALTSRRKVHHTELTKASHTHDSDPQVDGLTAVPEDPVSDARAGPGINGLEPGAMLALLPVEHVNARLLAGFWATRATGIVRVYGTPSGDNGEARLREGGPVGPGSLELLAAALHGGFVQLEGCFVAGEGARDELGAVIFNRVRQGLSPGFIQRNGDQALAPVEGTNEAYDLPICTLTRKILGLLSGRLPLSRLVQGSEPELLDLDLDLATLHLLSLVRLRLARS